MQGLDLVLDFNLSLVESSLVWCLDLGLGDLWNFCCEGDIDLAERSLPVAVAIFVPFCLELFFLLEVKRTLINQVLGLILLFFFLFLSLLALYSVPRRLITLSRGVFTFGGYLITFTNYIHSLMLFLLLVLGIFGRALNSVLNLGVLLLGCLWLCSLSFLLFLVE